MASPISTFKPEYCQVAIDTLKKGKSLAALCCEFNVSRQTLYTWRERHEEFRDAISTGLQYAQVYWEEIGESGIAGQIEKFSATPWIFMMKKRFREDYEEEKKEEKSEATSLLEKLITGEIKVPHD